MKRQINPTIKAHLIRSAFYVILLLAVCVIPFAVAQRNTTKPGGSATALQAGHGTVRPSLIRSAGAPKASEMALSRARKLPATISNTFRGQVNVQTKNQPRRGPAFVETGPVNQPQLPAPKAPAVVLYDQYDNFDDNAFESNLDADAPDVTDYMADDFVVPAGQTWTITEIDALGIQFGQGGATFNVDFYTNGADNLPDTQVYTTTSGTYTTNGTDWVITIPPAVLTEGTYWVMVQGNGTNNPFNSWFWQGRLVQSNDTAAWQQPGNAYGRNCISWQRKPICFSELADSLDQVFRLVGTMGGGTPTPTPTCVPGGGSWSAGTPLPTPATRSTGVYFPANGRFYVMGGRSSDTAGSDFTNPFEFDPATNTWTTKAGTYPDNQVNNMACGVLNESGTDFIYCVGGSAAGQTTAIARVFRYDPVTDTLAALDPADDWPGDAAGTILPGGFAVANNKLYILGGFNINVASTNEIWEFDPTAAVGSKWTQKVNTPVGVMYAPTCTINGIIYLAGASDFDPVNLLVIDTTNSFSFDPVGNSIGSVAAIPRATGETRALTFNGQMLVMGGGRVAPNPSSEVDVYDPGTDTWSTGTPFVTARRNFPTDTDGTGRIWLAGGYAPSTPTDSMEIFGCASTPTPTPTPTPTATPGGCQFHVLLVYSDEGPPTQLQSQIQAEPNVVAVDLFDAQFNTPDLNLLQQYDIVVPFSNFVFADPFLLGDNLADYVDGGGIAVQYGFSHYGPGIVFGIYGRWLDDGYNPYDYSENLGGNAFSLGTFDAGHPLMAGVTALNSNFQNLVTPNAAATEVAQTSLGDSLVAFRPVGGHTTVGVTAYVGSVATQSGDWGKVIVNAGNWLRNCQGVTPTPTATATATATATPTATPSATVTPTFPPPPSATPIVTPTITPPPSATPSATAIIRPTPTPRPRPTPYPRPTP